MVEKNTFPSSQRRRGCAEGADGVVSSATISAGLTTPARQLLLSCRATPPLRGGEYVIRVLVVCTLAIAAGCLALEVTAIAQSPAALPRTADGKPNLNGIWQVLNTAAWNIQDHGGELGIPPGLGVVEGGEIPYQSQALAKKEQNRAKRMTADPTEANCFLPGVPRATYMPYPFQIVQTSDNITIRYQFAHALRMIPVNGSKHAEGVPSTWMGDSRGRWEGDTLVIDVANFNNETWFDHAGNFHSDELRVVERYTMTSANHMLYEATIEDPKVFTRP